MDSAAPDFAAAFSAMAERIRHNVGQSFGGAFVVVPPQNGPVLETLILDNKQDEAQYWLLLKTKCEMALNEIDAKERAGASIYGRPR